MRRQIKLKPKILAKVKGAAKPKSKQFPDLSGDGKVTKKDILMGRGVIKKKSGGSVSRGMGAATQGGKFQGVF